MLLVYTTAESLREKQRIRENSKVPWPSPAAWNDSADFLQTFEGTHGTTKKLTEIQNDSNLLKVCPVCSVSCFHFRSCSLGAATGSVACRVGNTAAKRADTVWDATTSPTGRSTLHSNTPQPDQLLALSVEDFGVFTAIPV